MENKEQVIQNLDEAMDLLRATCHILKTDSKDKNETYILEIGECFDKLLDVRRNLNRL